MLDGAQCFLDRGDADQKRPLVCKTATETKIQKATASTQLSRKSGSRQTPAEAEAEAEASRLEVRF